jgi:hypothetical protein
MHRAGSTGPVRIMALKLIRAAEGQAHRRASSLGTTERAELGRLMDETKRRLKGVYMAEVVRKTKGEPFAAVSPSWHAARGTRLLRVAARLRRPFLLKSSGSRDKWMVFLPFSSDALTAHALLGAHLWRRAGGRR